MFTVLLLAPVSRPGLSVVARAPVDHADGSHPSAARVESAPSMAADPVQPARVDPAVTVAVRSGTTTFLVQLAEIPSGLDSDAIGADPSAGATAARPRVAPPPADPAARIQATRQLLDAGADRSVRVDRALAALKQRGAVTAVEPFPAFGFAAVTGDASAVASLARETDVVAIRAIRTHHLQAAPAVVDAGRSLPTGIGWNLTQVGAPALWSRLGATGEGAVVAVLDTGADWRHPALASAYRGRSGDHNYHWFDATASRDTEPRDLHGHGTHVTGLIAGRDGPRAYGVAPGAEWVAVRVFDGQGETTDLTLLRGAAWLLAPTRLDGTTPRADLAPDIVSCSWNLDNGADPLFDPVVDAWRAAGILPVFAAGNTDGDPSGPDRILSPASDPDALAVGALTSERSVWWRSRRGPGFHGGVKPDLAAPGAAILSTWPENQTAYADGTSMATPHVAGAAALLLSLNPQLGVDDLAAILRASADDLGAPGADLESGWGALDALAAGELALSMGRLAGQVLDASGTPLAGASVTVPAPARAGADWRWGAQSDAGGHYSLAVPAGTWTARSAAFGFTAQSEPVRVEAGQTLARNFRLAQDAGAVVRGQLVSAAGRPLAEARVAVIGASAATGAGADGEYAITLPFGRHVLRFSARDHRAVTTTVEIDDPAPVEQPVTLPTAPSILVVDADAWDAERIAPYLGRALADAGYAFAERGIDDPARVPTAEDLAGYDLVIWAHGYHSPGYLDMLRGDKVVTGRLTDFVARGGRLIVTGQDVGVTDARQPRRPGLAPEFFEKVLGAILLADIPSVPALLHGNGPLEGVDLDLRWPEGAEKGRLGIRPDVIAPAPGHEPGAVQSLLAYPDGRSAALASSDAAGRRVYLAFGPESAGGRQALAQLFDRLIAWIEPPLLDIAAPIAPLSPGATVALTVTVRSGRAPTPSEIAVDLPPALAWDAASPGEGRDPQHWRWSGLLEAGEAHAFELTARLAGPAPGGRPLPVLATLVSAGRPVTATAEVHPRTPDLDASTFEARPGRRANGGELALMLHLANRGPAAADAATAGIVLPPDMTPITRTLAATAGTAQWTPDGQVTWQGTVAPDAAVDVTVSGLVPGDLGTVHVAAATLDDGAGRAITRTAASLVGGPDLSPSKLEGLPATLLAGAAYTASLHLVNDGASTADALAHAVLPPDVSLAETAGGWSEIPPRAAAQAGALAAAQAGVLAAPQAGVGASTRHLFWSGPVAPGATVEVPLPLVAAAGAASGERELSVRMTDGWLPEQETALAARTELRRADLGASRIVLLPTAPRSGGVLSATLLVANFGDAPAPVELVDALAPALVPLAPSVRASTGTVALHPGTVEWKLVAVPPVRADYGVAPGPAAAVEAGGTHAPALRPGVHGPIALGLAFPFYTEVYTQVWATDDGLLTFGPPGADPAAEFGAGGPGDPMIAPLFRRRPTGTQPLDVQLLHGAQGITLTWSAAGDPSGESGFQAVLEESGAVRFAYGRSADLNGARSGLRAPDGHAVEVPPAYLRPGRSVEMNPPGGWAWLRFQTRVGFAVEANGLVGHLARLRGAGREQTLAAAVRANRLRLDASAIDATPSMPVAGSTIRYVLRLTATGEIPARDVELWVDIPDATSLDPASLGPELAYDAAADALRWRGSVAPDRPRLFTWSSVVRAGVAAGARIVTRAEIRPRTTGVPVVHLLHATRLQTADLSGSTKTAHPPVARTGTPVRFTLRAANAGPKATVVEVTDALPPELAYEPGSAAASTGEPPEWDALSRTLRWQGDVPAAGAVEIRFTARYAGTGPVTNVMRVAEEAGAHFAAWAEVLPERARVFLPQVVR